MISQIGGWLVYVGNLRTLCIIQNKYVPDILTLLMRAYKLQIMLHAPPVSIQLNHWRVVALPHTYIQALTKQN